MQSINEIEELVRLISRLPGLGPKSAKRIVLKLINNRDELVKPMANILAQVYKNVIRCQLCGTLKSNLIGCNKVNFFKLLTLMQYKPKKVKNSDKEYFEYNPKYEKNKKNPKKSNKNSPFDVLSELRL